MIKYECKHKLYKKYNHYVYYETSFNPSLGGDEPQLKRKSEHLKIMTGKLVRK